MTNGAGNGGGLNTNEEKIRQAAENVLLVFLSRWATLLLVPLIVATGGWIVTSINNLTVEVQTIRSELRAQGELFESKLKSVDTNLTLRVQNAERRLDRLELHQDKRTRVE